MTPTHCPHCGADMQGAPIPEKDREAYGGHTHGSRLIGISNGDSIMYWRCPDCKKNIPRDLAREGGFRTCNVEVKRVIDDKMTGDPMVDDLIEQVCEMRAHVRRGDEAIRSVAELCDAIEASRHEGHGVVDQRLLDQLRFWVRRNHVRIVRGGPRPRRGR